MFEAWKAVHTPQGTPVIRMPEFDLPADQMALRFDQIEAQLEQWRQEENRRLEAAMVRIKACAFLHGFLNAFTGKDAFAHHYSWCPYEQWQQSGYAPIKWVVPALKEEL